LYAYFVLKNTRNKNIIIYLKFSLLKYFNYAYQIVRKRVNLKSRARNLRRLSSVKRNPYIQRLCADGVQLILLSKSVLLFLHRFPFLPDILTPAPIASWFFLRYY